jgi:hypothetical protein
MVKEFNEVQRLEEDEFITGVKVGLRDSNSIVNLAFLISKF